MTVGSCKNQINLPLSSPDPLQHFGRIHCCDLLNSLYLVGNILHSITGCYIDLFDGRIVMVLSTVDHSEVGVSME